MFTKQDIQRLAKKYNIRPSKSKGQNFLIDQKALQHIVKTANIQPGDRVLEVGPGFGSLTFLLLRAGAEVWAVEADTTLAAKLKETQNAVVEHSPVEERRKATTAGAKAVTDSGREMHITSRSKLHIIKQDIRKLNIARTIPQPYKVVANLPYNITSWFLRAMLESSHQPQSMTLLLQKEVAQRIIAKPGNLSLLALSVQYYAQPRITKIVSKSSFWPQPEVHSAVVHLENIHQPSYKHTRQLFHILHMAFAGKRKQIHNTLKHGLPITHQNLDTTLKAVGIDRQLRPQQLTLAQWQALTDMLVEQGYTKNSKKML